MCRTLEEATGALALVKEWTASADLTLHPTKTRLVDERKDGFDFLGYHFEASRRWPRSKSLKRFRDTIRAKTKRSCGRSMSQTIADVNLTPRGWETASALMQLWNAEFRPLWLKRRSAPR
jgi:RNA-directed DNA polymerase